MNTGEDSQSDSKGGGHTLESEKIEGVEVTNITKDSFYLNDEQGDREVFDKLAKMVQDFEPYDNSILNTFIPILNNNDTGQKYNKCLV